MDSKRFTFDHVLWFTRQAQVLSVLLGAVIGLILVVFSKHAGYGFLTGVVLSVINFRLMNTDLFSMADMKTKKLRPFALFRPILRYSVMFGFMAFIASVGSLDIVSAFAGLLFVHIVLVASQLNRGLRTLGNIFRG